MLDVMLDTIDPAMASSKDLYLAVRIGESQKFTRVSSGTRKLTFPEKAFAGKSFGKLEVFRHIGGCTFGTDAEMRNSFQDLSMTSGSGLDDLRFRIRLGNPQEAGTRQTELEKSERGRSEAQEYLEKHQLQLRLADMMQTLLRERPSDPVAFINAKLQENEHIVKQSAKLDASQAAPPVPPAPGPKIVADLSPAPKQAQGIASTAPPCIEPALSLPAQPVTEQTQMRPGQQAQPELSEQLERPEQAEQSEKLVQPDQQDQPDQPERAAQRSEARKKTASWKKKGCRIFDEAPVASPARPVADLMAEMRTALEKSTENGLLQETLEGMVLSDNTRQAGSSLHAAASDGHLSRLLATPEITPSQHVRPVQGVGTCLEEAGVNAQTACASSSPRHADTAKGCAEGATSSPGDADAAKRDAQSALQQAAVDGSLEKLLTSLKQQELQNPPQPPALP